MFVATLCSVLGSGDMGHYELHMCVKDYCFGRDDQTVGVAVVQLDGLEETGSCALWCPLARHVTVNSLGAVILHVLMQRPHDEQAKTFIRLKSDCRHGDHGPVTLP